MVKFGSTPTPVPDGIVETLISTADEAGVVRFDELIEQGDAVRVIGGPFDNFLGIVEAAKDADRVRVLLDLMSRQVKVTVAKNELILVR